MIFDHAPYTKDKELIAKEMERWNQQSNQFSSVIERNTEAINALRVEIAKLQK